MQEDKTRSQKGSTKEERGGGGGGSHKHLFAGAISGGIASAILQPFDVIKTRIQQGEPGRGGGGGGGGANPRARVPRLVYDIVKKEKGGGVGQLWMGLVPTLYRTVPGVGLYFYSLNLFRDELLKTKQKTFLSSPRATDSTTQQQLQLHQDHLTLTTKESLVLGGVTRGFVGFVMLPFTVVKTRFESGLFNYSSVSGALHKIWQKETIRGWYSGSLATIMRDAPFSGVYYASYEALKHEISTRTSPEFKKHCPPVLIHMTCGFWAGVLATVVTHPPDVIKTKMQLCPDKYPNTFRTITHIIATHPRGVIGLFDGLLVRLVRRPLMAAITWSIYEELKLIY